MAASTIAEEFRCNEAADKVKDGGRLCLRMGSLSVIQFGKVRYDESYFHNHDAIYPVGYKSIRRYWAAPAIPTDTETEEEDGWEGGEDMNTDINGSPLVPGVICVF